MSASDEIPRAQEELRRQMEELKRIFGRILKVAESGGKPEVIAFLSKEFDAEPIERGNDVLIGTKLIQFDGNGNFAGMTSDPDQPTIAIPRQSTYDGDSGDT